MPSIRWSNTYYDPDKTKKGKIYTQKGGFIENMDMFDPGFFGISPRAAAFMDPQQRVLLEVTWEALEDGGVVPSKLAGRNVGVYIGLFMHDYENIHTGHSEYKLYGHHSTTGMSTTISANRISHIFDFRGPSLIVDTACSSSLVAIHLACQSLLKRESGIAVAGGVNILIKPEITMTLCEASMLSPDGYCKSFDAAADGYTRSEGAGIVVLKQLSEALKDNNRIYAVIRGSAVNQDGRGEGLTVPNEESQISVIHTALKQAHISPKDVQYVEAHGTGTPVGDPIEANSLGKVLSLGRPADKPCIIGSVKSNIGHTESAAGVAGLIKAALMLKFKKIPPNLHFINPNPKISFDQLNLRVPASLEPWNKDGEKPRIAGINSFGFGGTNAHVILEEMEEQSPHTSPDTPSKDTPVLIPVSGHTPEALYAMAGLLKKAC